MNDQSLADTIRHALGNIIDDAPAPAPWPLQAAVPPRSSTPRWMAPVAAAAIGVVGTGSVVWVAGRDEQGSSEVPTSLSSTEPRTTIATSPVLGEPTCGDELPIGVVVARSEGMHPGQVAGTPDPVSGQLIVHWQLPGGSIEARWPADERIDYDLDGRFGGSNEVASDMSSVVPEGGRSIGVLVPALDPALNQTGPQNRPETIVLPVGDATETQAPCDVLQVRYISTDGDMTTLGYPLHAISLGESIEPWDVDLNPLVVSSQQGAIDPDDVVACNGVHGGDIADPTVADTPVAALGAFLATESAQGLFDSRYDEYVAADSSSYAYGRTENGRLIALIQVEPVGDGWAATFRLHPGC